MLMVCKIQLASHMHIFFCQAHLIVFYPSYLFVLIVPCLININFTVVIIIIIIIVLFTQIIDNFFCRGWGRGGVLS